MAFEIHDLSERLHHADGVATRIWKAFWEPYGTPYEQIRTGLDGLLKATTPIPFAMVAEVDGRLCGNTLVIANDEDARPALTPWIAAVWVDEDCAGGASPPRSWKKASGAAACWVFRPSTCRPGRACTTSIRRVAGCSWRATSASMH